MVSISIIIPVYNAEQYIRRCVESIMAQDSARADIECILVDDCGKDQSMEIVEQMMASYEGPIRFAVLDNRINRGISVSRNSGLLKAKGDYVLFVDADDYLMPNAVQYFLDHLNQYPQADILIGNVISKKDGKPMLNSIAEPVYIETLCDFLQQALQRKLFLQAWNKLIRRDILISKGISFMEGIIYEDEPWTYQLLSSVSSVVLLPQTTYVYENNVNSIVNTTFTLEKADLTVWSYAKSSNLILDQPPKRVRNQVDLTADFLLFVGNILTRAYDVQSYHCSRENRKLFESARARLLKEAWRRKRIVVFLFLRIFLYAPFANLKHWKLFRHNYYRLERTVGKAAHWADCLHHILHRKERI